MSIPPQGDKEMLKSYNYTSENTRKEENYNPIDQLVNNQQRNDIMEKQRKSVTINTNEKNNDLDIFLTLILKNLESHERALLLNLLLKIDWEQADESLEAHLQDLIDRKSEDEEGHNIYEYDQFLWDFRNWKNFFTSKK